MQQDPTTPSRVWLGCEPSAAHHAYRRLSGIDHRERLEILYARGLITEEFQTRLTLLMGTTRAEVWAAMPLVDAMLRYADRIQTAECLLTESGLGSELDPQWVMLTLPRPYLPLPRDPFRCPWILGSTANTVSRNKIARHRNLAWEISLLHQRWNSTAGITNPAPASANHPLLREQLREPCFWSAVRYCYLHAPRWARSFMDLGCWFAPPLGSRKQWRPVLIAEDGISPGWNSNAAVPSTSVQLRA